MEIVEHTPPVINPKARLVENHEFFIPNLHSMPPTGSPRWNIAITFPMEKLAWCDHPMMKKILRI